MTVDARRFTTASIEKAMAAPASLSFVCGASAIIAVDVITPITTTTPLVQVTCLDGSNKVIATSPPLPASNSIALAQPVLANDIMDEEKQTERHHLRAQAAVSSELLDAVLDSVSQVRVSLHRETPINASSSDAFVSVHWRRLSEVLPTTVGSVKSAQALELTPQVSSVALPSDGWAVVAGSGVNGSACFVAVRLRDGFSLVFDTDSASPSGSNSSILRRGISREKKEMHVMARSVRQMSSTPSASKTTFYLPECDPTNSRRCVSFLRCVAEDTAPTSMGADEPATPSTANHVGVHCVALRHDDVLVTVSVLFAIPATSSTTPGPPTSVRSSTLVRAFAATAMRVNKAAVCTCIATTTYGAVIAAVTVAHGQPSTLVKWRISNAALTDTLSLGWVPKVELPVVARALRAERPVHGQQELTVVAMVGQFVQLRMLSISLAAITAVTPSVVDSVGGTTVTFTGEGFDANTSYWCRVGRIVSDANALGRDGVSTLSSSAVASPSTSAAPSATTVDEEAALSIAKATVRDSTTLVCVAPPATKSAASGDDSCSTRVAEIVMHDMITTAMNVQVRRPDSVVVSAPLRNSAVEVSNSSVGQWSATFGYGVFYPSSEGSATCVLRDASGQVVSTGLASIVASRIVRCNMNRVSAPTVPPAMMRFSHDGFVFAETGAVFAVVGSAAGVAARIVPQMPDPNTPAYVVSLSRTETSTWSRVKLPAKRVVMLPIITAHIVDINGNAVITTPDDISCTFSISGPALDGAVVVLKKSALFDDVAAGFAVLANATVASPKSERLDIIVTAKAGQWVSTASVDIVPGPPDRLKVISDTTKWRYQISSTAITSLRPAPRVVVVDAAGNIVTDRALLPQQMTMAFEHVFQRSSASYAVASDNETVTLAEILQGIEFRFGNAVLYGAHDVQYTLRFSVAPAFGIAGATVSVPVEPCGSREWAIVKTTACQSCPSRAVCDGTTSLRPSAGSWRGATTSSIFYECKTGACPPVLEGDTEPICRDGHMGPMCSVCGDGYGMATSKCHRCPSGVVAWSMVALIVGVCAVVLTAFVELSLRAGRVTLIALLRITLTYLQLLTGAVLSSQSIPKAAKESLETIQAIASLDISTVLFGCTFAETYFSLYLPLVLIIPTFCIIYAVITGVLTVTRFVMYKREQQAIAASASPGSGGLIDFITRPFRGSDGGGAGGGDDAPQLLSVAAAPSPTATKGGRLEMRRRRADSLMMGVVSSTSSDGSSSVVIAGDGDFVENRGRHAAKVHAPTFMESLDLFHADNRKQTIVEHTGAVAASSTTTAPLPMVSVLSPANDDDDDEAIAHNTGGSLANYAFPEDCAAAGRHRSGDTRHPGEASTSRIAGRTIAARPAELHRDGDVVSVVSAASRSVALSDTLPMAVSQSADCNGRSTTKDQSPCGGAGASPHDDPARHEGDEMRGEQFAGGGDGEGQGSQGLLHMLPPRNSRSQSPAMRSTTSALHGCSTASLGQISVGVDHGFGRGHGTSPGHSLTARSSGFSTGGAGGVGNRGAGGGFGSSAVSSSYGGNLSRGTHPSPGQSIGQQSLPNAKGQVSIIVPSQESHSAESHTSAQSSVLRHQVAAPRRAVSQRALPLPSVLTVDVDVDDDDDDGEFSNGRHATNRIVRSESRTSQVQDPVEDVAAIAARRSVVERAAARPPAYGSSVTSALPYSTPSTLEVTAQDVHSQQMREADHCECEDRARSDRRRDSIESINDANRHHHLSHDHSEQRNPTPRRIASASSRPREHRAASHRAGADADVSVGVDGFESTTSSPTVTDGSPFLSASLFNRLHAHQDGHGSGDQNEVGGQGGVGVPTQDPRVPSIFVVHDGGDDDDFATGDAADRRSGPRGFLGPSSSRAATGTAATTTRGLKGGGGKKADANPGSPARSGSLEDGSTRSAVSMGNRSVGSFFTTPQLPSHDDHARSTSGAEAHSHRSSPGRSCPGSSRVVFPAEHRGEGAETQEAITQIPGVDISVPKSARSASMSPRSFRKSPRPSARRMGNKTLSCRALMAAARSPEDDPIDGQFAGAGTAGSPGADMTAVDISKSPSPNPPAQNSQRRGRTRDDRRGVLEGGANSPNRAVEQSPSYQLQRRLSSVPMLLPPALVRRRATAVTAAQRYCTDADNNNNNNNNGNPNHNRDGYHQTGGAAQPNGAITHDTGNIGHFLKRRKLPPISMTATTVKEAVMLWLERLVAAFFVISFVLYPTVMKYSGQLLLCRTIDHGILGQASYLTVDMSIECSGWKFTAFRVVAITVLVIFGLGFPIGAMLLIKLFRRVSLNRRRTAQLFQFVVGGYEPHLWFWESVMIARKAAIAFANFGIADVSLRSYVMMWTIAAGFTLDVVFVPFRNKRQQIVDALAMAAIAVSLNLVQLYPFADEDTDSGLALTWAITCVALTVNLIAIAAVVWALSGTAREIILSAEMLPAWVVSRLSGGTQDEAAWQERAAEARRVQHSSVTRSHPRLALLQRAIAAVPTPGSSIATVVRIHDTLSRVIPSVVDATPDLAPGDLQLLYQVERDLVELVIHILMQHHQIQTDGLRRQPTLVRRNGGASSFAERGEINDPPSGLDLPRRGTAAPKFGHMALPMQALTPADPQLDLSQSFGSMLSSDLGIVENPQVGLGLSTALEVSR